MNADKLESDYLKQQFYVTRGHNTGVGPQCAHLYEIGQEAAYQVEHEGTLYNVPFDEADEYIIGTYANGELVHGKCSPRDAVMDSRGFFECAKMVELPGSYDSTYTFETVATAAVDDMQLAYEGSLVYVEYMVDCEGTCQPPSAPPLPPTCGYSATPAGGGNSSGDEPPDLDMLNKMFNKS